MICSVAKSLLSPVLNNVVHASHCTMPVSPKMLSNIDADGPMEMVFPWRGDDEASFYY